MVKKNRNKVFPILLLICVIVFGGIAFYQIEASSSENQDFDALQAENQRLQEQVAEYEQQIVTLKEEKNNLKRENKELVEKTRDLGQTIRKMADRSNVVLKENARLQEIIFHLNDSKR